MSVKQNCFRGPQVFFIAIISIMCLGYTTLCAQVDQVDIDSDPRVTLGRGYHPTKTQPAGDCVDYDPSAVEVDAAQEVIYQFHVAKSRDELREALDVSVEAAVKVAFFSGGGKARFQREVGKNSFSTFGIVSVVIRSGARRLRHPKLKEEYAKLYRNDKQAFFETCGDVFVNAITKGGLFYGVIEVFTRSESEKKSTEAALALGTGTYSASTEVQKIMQRLKTLEDVRVHTYSVGGQGLKIPKNLDEIIDFASTFPQKILTTFKGREGDTARPPEGAEKDIQAWMTSYSTLQLPEPWPVLLTALHKRRLRGLFHNYEDADQLVNDIRYILDNSEQFVSPQGEKLTEGDRDGLGEVRAQIATYQNELSGVIEACVKVSYLTLSGENLLGACLPPPHLVPPEIVLPRRIGADSGSNPRGDQKDMQEFIKWVLRKPDPGFTDRNGWSDLHYAAVLNLPTVARNIWHKRREAKMPINPPLLRGGVLGGDTLSVLTRLGWKNVYGEPLRVGQTPLHIAAQENSAAFLEEALGGGIPAGAKDSYGRNALHYAAYGNAKEAAEVLLGYAKELAFEPDETNRGPLFYALMLGNTEVARFLINSEAGVLSPQLRTDAMLQAGVTGNLGLTRYLVEEAGGSVHVTDGHGRTSLHNAAAHGSVELVRFLLGKDARLDGGDDGGWRPLHYAAVNGRWNVVRFLKAKGADVDARTEKGETALYVAVAAGRSEVVRLLVKQGAAVDVEDHAGTRPVHLAARTGDAAMLRFLVVQGAEAEAKDKDDWTALHWAAWEGHGNVVRLLLGRSANVRVRDQHGRTPLHLAAASGWLDVLRLLNKRSGLLAVRDNAGATPLHFGTGEGRLTVVQYLLEEGADLEARDETGRRPLHWAVSGESLTTEDLPRDRIKISPDHRTVDEQTGVIEVLLGRGADIEAKDVAGARPLHIAAGIGRLKYVSLLLKNRAEIDATDDQGWRPLHNATYRGGVEIVRHLLKRGANPCAASHNGILPVHLVDGLKINQKPVEKLLKPASRHCVRPEPLPLCVEFNWRAECIPRITP